MNLKSKKGRKQNDQILIEGTRFIRDAIETGMVPEHIVYSRTNDVKEFMESNLKKTKFYKVPYRSIQLWSTLTTSPGVMGKSTVII